MTSSPAQMACLSLPAVALLLGICSVMGPRLQGWTSCREKPATRTIWGGH